MIDSVLLSQGARVQSLVRELRSHMLCSMAKRFKKISQLSTLLSLRMKQKLYQRKYAEAVAVIKVESKVALMVNSR